jgi:ElaB/YqjD/DUF883 family membrane-anchored ribosome-binding protein
MEEPRRQQQESGQAQQVADQTREKVGEAAGQAKEKAHSLAGQAQDRIREQVDERSTQAGERVGSTAQDIRTVGEELRNQGQEGPAKIAEQTANRIDHAGTYLRDSDADRILNDVEDFGRSRPWAVLAGAVVVGFAAARFLKASSRERYSTRESGASVEGSRVRRRLPATSRTAGVAPATESAEDAVTPAGVR